MHLHLLKSFFSWKSCQLHQPLPELGLRDRSYMFLVGTAGKIIPWFNNLGDILGEMRFEEISSL